MRRSKLMNSNESLNNLDMSPIACKLNELPKIELIKVDRTPQETTWDYLVSQYHYLGFKKMFGRRIKYLVMAGEHIVAAISFNQGTSKIKARDLYIGWTKEQRERNLEVIANNNRFLIVPWVKVKYLASHILSLAVHQVERDWKEHYGTRLLLLETFVDRSRYKGTSYLAANWRYVGDSSGYSRLRDGSYTYHGNLKGVYIYNLKRNYRKVLGCDITPNHCASRMHKCEEVLKMLAHQIIWEPDILKKAGIVPDQVEQISEKFYEYYYSYENSFRHIHQLPLGQAYLMGLMSKLERKSVEPIALQYLDANGVRALQSFITDSPWDDKKMEVHCRAHVSERINDPDNGMITFDESDFLKKGNNSAGVMRQYCGVVGATNNCQAGIFMGYSGNKGYGLIGNQLYIPKKWFDEEHESLRNKCKFPDDIEYKDKCDICLELLDKVRREEIFQAKWIGCDSLFGSDHKFRDKISGMGYYYFADIHSNICIWSTMPQMRPTRRKDKDGISLKGWPATKPIPVKDFVMQDKSVWIEAILGEGSKGPIRSHIKLFRVYENIDGLPGREVWLFVRKFADGKLKFSLSNAPEETPVEKLDRMSISRWTIEQGFEECKTELGMDHYEVRSYKGWHRHMLFVMMAHEFLCRIQNMFKKNRIHISLMD
jgi:SRSO17 transposase